MRRAVVGSIGVCLALLTPSRSAWSQAPDPATARALFEEGTKALDKGDWESACPRFDASFALKPTVSALLNIAKCHEHAGKLMLAADDYHRALAVNEDTVSQARKKELAEFTGEALRKLEARIPRLVIVVKDPPPEVRITRDGQVLPRAALGLPLPVDPGGHVVVASAPGRKTETRSVTLAEGKDGEVAIDLLPEVAAPPAPPQPPPPPALRVLPAGRDAPAPVPPPSGIPTWAWISGAVGIALGSAAVTFAVDGAGANCGGPCTDRTFKQADLDALNARRHRDLGLGLGLGGAGAVALAIGAIGIATAPQAPPRGFLMVPWLGRGIGGMGFQGGF